MSGDGAPGWFGKLACLGDFGSRRLPPAFVQACDAWLSQGVAASRAQLGERWLDVYLTGPLWRFAWAPAVVDAQWWFGVVMPSVDKVGRYFPLVVALPRREAPADGESVQRLLDWFDEVARAALATLRGGATLEGFESALQATAPLAEGRPAALRLQGRTLWSPQREDSDKRRVTIVPGLPAPESFGELLRGAW